MDSINHQMMGYDRAITMFSPDGRLLQVEYAKKTVKQGSTAIGMVCADGVLLVCDKRIVDPLVVTEAIEKIFQIDEHIGATASGIISDARVLIERAQVKAQQHQVTYDTPIDTLTIVKNICDLKQICTQSGGLRPFGVSILVAGIDADGPKLFETDPTGIFFQYNAVVIGEGEEGIEEILHKKYKPALNLQEGLRISVEALKQVLDDKFNAERLDAAFIKTNDRKFVKVDKKELERVLKQAKGGN
ncbi:archaeal proteasome endopeptidase complex subunit alpha [Candidatus Woesearchaeota archaeon]|nr:archaeal proteasome endopeptidase complex subunit alpha [Candidatus Woesearchaeota archaeon]